MDIPKSLSMVPILLLLLPGLLMPVVGGTREVDLEHISDPGSVIKFENMTTPQIEPGDSGTLNFTITNRYDKEIRNVNLTVEIYFLANTQESRNISKISKPPYFTTTRSQKTNKVWNTIDPGETKNDGIFHISSRTGSAEGTYFVRFQITFYYNCTNSGVYTDDCRYILKSRGHFTQEEWDAATFNATDDDPGNINITRLGVDGIIPDTTFGLKKHWPMWPLYTLTSIAIFFAILALGTYFYDENVNPKFTRWVHQQQRKFDRFRNHLSKILDHDSKNKL